MDKDKIKTLSLRIPKDLWVFISKKSIDREISINNIIIERLNKYRKKVEKKVDTQ